VRCQIRLMMGEWERKGGWCEAPDGVVGFFLGRLEEEQSLEMCNMCEIDPWFYFSVCCFKSN